MPAIVSSLSLNSISATGKTRLCFFLILGRRPEEVSILPIPTPISRRKVSKVTRDSLSGYFTHARVRPVLHTLRSLSYVFHFARFVQGLPNLSLQGFPLCFLQEHIAEYLIELFLRFFQKFLRDNFRSSCKAFPRRCF